MKKSPNTKPIVSRTPVSRTALSRRRFVALGGGLLTSPGAALGAMQERSANPPRPVVKNRAPLKDVPFVALPLGSVKAHGWLRKQLELQRDGLTGRAEEVLPDVGPDSAWLGGKGEDWEKGPYYAKGLVALAYTLDEPGLKIKAQKWVDAILGSQQDDGFYGPRSNREWWPRMVTNYLLRDYAEATGDRRVVPFLTRYYGYMAANLDKKPLHEWAKARAGDEIDTLFWLYNRTGDGALLTLADKLAGQAYPWRDILTNNRFLEYGEDIHPKHNVNVPQAMKLPPVYYQRSGAGADRDAFMTGHRHLMRDHGLNVGINSGTEFLAGRSTTQGIETCSTVERMLSDETALRILGDARIGDNLEQLAFNALPAALSPNIHQHVYYTLPNSVKIVRGGVGYTQDHEDGRTPAPRSGFPCCCYNFHMGWPKLTQNAWAATSDGGLAVMAYVPSQVTAPVAGGDSVTWTAQTNYPFDDTIRLRLAAPRRARFPLVLRVPGWCSNATIAVNGKRQPAPKAGSWVRLVREWRPGDEVTVRFPMAVRTVRGVNDSVSVWRGPLLYGLKIEETWSAFDKNKIAGFESYEITPASAWNYALAGADAASIAVQRGPMPSNPFDPLATPVRLQARAKKVADWTLTRNGRISYDPPVSPVASDAPTETVTLVPFGAQMLRVSNFPVVGAPRPASSTFQDTFGDGHADNWITYGGGWLVQGDRFGPSPDATSSHAVATETRFRDFVFEADVQLGEYGDAGLIFRVTDSSIGPDNYNGYYVGLSAEKGQVTIGRAGGNWNPLQTVARVIPAKEPQRVRVEARGPRLRVWVGNVTETSAPLLDVTDATFAEGAVGLRQYGARGNRAQAAFARISVTAA